MKRRLALALVLAALSSGAVAAFALTGPSAGDGVLAVSLADDRIELESPTAAPGPQVIEATNTGSEEHELVVLKTNRAADDLAVGLHGVSIEHSGTPIVGEDHSTLDHEHAPGQVLGLLPGESRRFQVDLKPGDYVAFCQTASHYLEGAEYAAFSVR